MPEPGELIAAISPGSNDARGRFEGYTSEDVTQRKVDAFRMERHRLRHELGRSPVRVVPRAAVR